MRIVDCDRPGHRGGEERVGVLREAEIRARDCAARAVRTALAITQGRWLSFLRD
jgi:hypothetical protein